MFPCASTSSTTGRSTAGLILSRVIGCAYRRERGRTEWRRRRPVDHQLEVNPVIWQLQEIRLVEPLVKFANEVWGVFRADAK